MKYCLLNVQDLGCNIFSRLINKLLMRNIVLLLIVFLSIGFDSNGQITPNNVDSLGLKQGMWKEFKIPFDIVTQYIGIKVPEINREYYLFTKDKDRKYFPIIECIGEYKNGLKTGVWIEYYSNEKIKSQIEYKNGMPFGKCEMFWENGSLKMQCIICSVGNFPIIIYNEDGTLLSKQEGIRAEVIKAIYEN